VRKAKISEFVKAFGQNMLEDAANELVAVQAAAAPERRFALLVPDSDGVVVEGDDARIGDGDAE
jgi:hypothetical protein